MHYDKGEQLTVGRLKEYLACLPDDVKVFVGIGSEISPAYYLLERNGGLLLHPDSWMQNADEINKNTILKLSITQSP